ncbi:MAG TPA: hypothetical protein DCQ84_02600 [Candidatus Competibacteraceae bacterium]|nr:hypothetical protein [Candidatus Competibacteraceae bacterium]
MSNVHHIGDSAEPVNRPLSITPRHPLLVGATLKRADVRDVLNNCANTLVMLADLLGDADQTRFPTLDSGEARRGMFLQLHGVANTLEAIEKLLGAKGATA